MNGLLLPKFAMTRTHTPTGKVMTLHSSTRWCSDCFEIKCFNGEKGFRIFCFRYLRWEQLKWVLFTNLDLNTKEDALKVVNYYRLRWQVEDYFKVLKDGYCHVEHANLRHFDRLDKYTACFSIIAWRLFWMKFLYHTDPYLPARAILTDLEIEVLRVRYQDLQKEKLTVGKALKLIAMFGGYNNRKSDGPPGNVTLWREFMIIRDRAEYHEELVIAKKVQ